MTVRINRPKSAPGLEQDLQWALERAQKRARDAEIERDRMMLYMDHGWFWGPAGALGRARRPRRRGP